MEMFDFFRKLKKNNNKTWLDAHRREYETFVLNPAREFVTAMGPRLAELSEGIIADPRTNRSLFRINRDTRFSPDKSPYKTNLAMIFWRGPGKRMESSGFYLHFEPDHFFWGAGIYMFPDHLLRRYRQAVVHPEKGPQLVKIVEELNSRPGLTVGGRHYKRVPSGMEAEGPAADLLLHRGLYTGGEPVKYPPEMFQASFVDYCIERFRSVLPLHNWLVDLGGRP